MSKRRRKKAVETQAVAPTGKEGSAPAPKYQKKERSAPVVHKERGWLLSIIIVLIGVHGAFASWVVWATMKADYVQYQAWVLPLLVLISLGDILAAVAMWFWKRWGFYLYAVTQVVATAIALMLTGNIWVTFSELLPVAIVAYVIQYQHKLKYFE